MKTLSFEQQQHVEEEFWPFTDTRKPHHGFEMSEAFDFPSVLAAIRCRKKEVWNKKSSSDQLSTYSSND